MFNFLTFLLALGTSASLIYAAFLQQELSQSRDEQRLLWHRLDALEGRRRKATGSRAPGSNVIFANFKKDA